MSEWTSRVRDHRIWELMKGLGPTIDKALQLDDSDPASSEPEDRRCTLFRRFPHGVLGRARRRRPAAVAGLVITTPNERMRRGMITDLGTLGEPDSFINAPVKNESGEIAGFAETSTPDPLGEQFCAGFTVFGFHDGDTCLGFLWHDGVMAPLPPLAGVRCHRLATIIVFTNCNGGNPWVILRELLGRFCPDAKPLENLADTVELRIDITARMVGLNKAIAGDIRVKHCHD